MTINKKITSLGRMALAIFISSSIGIIVGISMHRKQHEDSFESGVAYQQKINAALSCRDRAIVLRLLREKRYDDLHEIVNNFLQSDLFIARYSLALRVNRVPENYFGIDRLDNNIRDAVAVAEDALLVSPPSGDKKSEEAEIRTHR